MAERKRLDIILVECGFFATREKARQMIMAGNVWVDGKRVDKSGTLIHAGADIEIKGEQNPYVSRGGLKLEKALEEFNINVRDKVAIDIGASTGGFTDCLLKNGAAKVYAVDVGYGQLAWSLRNDPRVVVMERINARYLVKDDLPEQCDIATIDVSFISLKHIFPAARHVLKPRGMIISLIKPQFEAGRQQVKKGVVKDPRTHVDVLRKVIDYSHDNKLQPLGLTFSPIKGPQGNIEFLGLFSSNISEKYNSVDLEELVTKAHKALD